MGRQFSIGHPSSEATAATATGHDRSARDIVVTDIHSSKHRVAEQAAAASTPQVDPIAIEYDHDCQCRQHSRGQRSERVGAGIRANAVCATASTGSSRAKPAAAAVARQISGGGGQTIRCRRVQGHSVE